MRIFGARIFLSFLAGKLKILTRVTHESKFSQPRQFLVNTFNKQENRKGINLYKFWFQGNFFKIAFDARF